MAIRHCGMWLGGSQEAEWFRRLPRFLLRLADAAARGEIARLTVERDNLARLLEESIARETRSNGLLRGIPEGRA